MQEHWVKFWDDLGKRGDAPALVFDGGHVLSYADLDRMAERLRQQIDPAWRLVAVEMAHSAHAVAALIACLRARVPAILLPADTDGELRAIRQRFRPDAVFRRTGERWRFREERERSHLTVHPDLALVLVTSGSTGEGKAVRISRAALGANAGQIAAGLSLDAGDRALLTLPLHYAYGLSVLTSHLLVGASVYLPGRAILEEGFAEAVALAGPTNLPGVPFTFELYERIGLMAQPPQGLRFATVAGGRMDPQGIAAWSRAMAGRNGRFYVMYGASEATARMSLLDATHNPGCETTIGLPVEGGRFEIVDETGAPVPDGTEGEICYCGPNIMMGYAATRKDLCDGPQLHRLMTGDIGLRRPDGLYQITGRKSRFSKIAGIRIGHDALEAAMDSCRLPCAVTGDDKALTAYHEQGNSEAYLHALADITRLGRTRLRVCRVERLPRLPNGKIDYRRLREVSVPVNQRADIETLFADCFFPHCVRPADSFASLAGDSLKHVELSLGLEKCLKHIPPGWETMTVERLSRLAAGPVAGRPVLGAELVIRALAIVMVVVQHATLWPVPGGAAAMTLLLGYAMARFQLPALAGGDYRTFFRPLVRILVPYYLILAGHAVWWGEIPWASVFLVGNAGLADPVRHTMLPYLYWFVEAFVQLLLLVAGLFAIPSIRRLGASDPFRLGIWFLLAAIALRFLSPLIWDIGNRKLFTLPWILPLAAFGWCAAHASSAARRALLLLLALAAMPVFALQGGNWTGSWVKYGFQLGVIALLLHMPLVPVFAWLKRPVLIVAHASFHIYLVHRFVPEILMLPFEKQLPEPVFVLLTVSGGVALGIATSRLQSGLVSLARRSKMPWRALRERPAGLLPALEAGGPR